MPSARRDSDTFTVAQETRVIKDNPLSFSGFDYRLDKGVRVFLPSLKSLIRFHDSYRETMELRHVKTS